MKRYLLDTHTLLWSVSDPQKLSSKGRFILEREKCVKLLSIVSIWEISLKRSLGKLNLPVSTEEFIATSQQDLGLEIVSLELPHIYTVEGLPFHHSDPFDRLLVAQAQCEKLQIISRDDSFDAYNVSRVW
ncbi:MAG: type II toxin-antitoxin system VapC family toxin [Deltaproteobacteria bacterium]|nr:type II toxin-antitoxin system VapC family toxin [Deltaproteobacteria bacterium]